MKKMVQNFFLFTLSLLLSLGFAEWAGRFFLPAPVPYKLPVILNQADPVCGYHPRPMQKGFGLSGRVEINRWGFRGRDWEIQKPAGTKRIAILGDSYGFGQGVDDEQTFASQLETMLNAVPGRKNTFEVMNFAAPGYDTGHEVKVLEHHALQFHPDLVLLQFFLNDLQYIEEYSFYPAMFKKMRQEFSPWKWQVREWLRRSPLLMAGWDFFKARTPDPIIQSYVTENRMPPGGLGEKGWKFVVERLRSFRELSKSHHFKPVVLIMPTPEEIVHRHEASYVHYLEDRCAELGIRTVNLTRAFENQGHFKASKFLIPYDYHLTPEGHRRIAVLLLKTISNFENQEERSLP